jgi:hypothetical protein
LSLAIRDRRGKKRTEGTGGHDGRAGRGRGRRVGTDYGGETELHKDDIGGTLDSDTNVGEGGGSW